MSKAEKQSKSFCSKTENLHPPETLTGNKREMSKEEAVLYNKAVCTMSGNVCNAVEKKSRKYCTTISGNVRAWGDRECNMVSAMRAWDESERERVPSAKCKMEKVANLKGLEP